MNTTTANDPVIEIRQRLALALGAAILAAGLILVMFVLPAEFAVDPLGTGAKLGLLPLGVVGQQVAALNKTTATGAAAGTLNGIKISGITPNSGTETALKIGAGWDTGLAISQNATGNAATITATAAVSIMRYGNTTFGFMSVSLGNVANRCRSVAPIRRVIA